MIRTEIQSWPIISQMSSEVLKFFFLKETKNNYQRFYADRLTGTGQVSGQHRTNPLLNTLMYDIEFPNGDVRKYAANSIALNLLAQVYPEGFHTNVEHQIAMQQTNLHWKSYLKQ